MNAIELLKGQHDEVKELFEKMEEAEGSEEKLALFTELADKLAAHSTIEEKLFYPSVYVGELKELLQEAVEEHLSAKRLIADLLELSADDESFEAKVKVLQEQIEHHVEEEEGELFKKVRKDFEAGELQAMGTQMKAMFEELIQTEPRNAVPSETGEAAPLS